MQSYMVFFQDGVNFPENENSKGKDLISLDIDSFLNNNLKNFDEDIINIIKYIPHKLLEVVKNKGKSHLYYIEEIEKIFNSLNFTDNDKNEKYFALFSILNEYKNIKDIDISMAILGLYLKTGYLLMPNAKTDEEILQSFYIIYNNICLVFQEILDQYYRDNNTIEKPKEETREQAKVVLDN